MTQRKRSIAARFSAAAGSYETAAEAQATAAARLAELVEGAGLPPSPRVLEVGCGTGLLTRRLLPALGGDWLVTDVAPGMVEQARAAVGEARARFRVMDAEEPDVEPASLDLVVSSLAAQWFSDLPGTLARLAACLRPGGLLALSTLGEGSFAQWRAAHHRLGLEAGTPAYPSAEALRAMMPPHTQSHVVAEPLVIDYPDGRAFLRALKVIGAGTPAPGHRPLPAGRLRAVLASVESPFQATYDLVYCLARREE